MDALAGLPEATAPSEEDRALVLETLLQVDPMLQRLPAKACTAFLTVQVEDCTHAEVAHSLKVSDHMVRKYLPQAMLQCLLINREVVA